MELLALIFVIIFGGLLICWMINTRQFYKQQEDSMKRCYKLQEGEE